MCNAMGSIYADPLCFRISSEVSEKCDREEAEWFVKEAANFLRFIASSGIFVKCFWYEGLIPQGPDGTLSVSSVVKKIKGLDGRNLERIQDRTGVIIGIVVNNKAVSFSQSSSADLPQRLIGVRIRCIRRKGISDASKKIQQLLGLAGNYFKREANENNPVQIDSKQSSPVPLPSSSTKRNLPSRNRLSSTIPPLSSSSPLEKQQFSRATEGGYMRMDVPDAYAPPRSSSMHLNSQPEDIYDDDVLHLEASGSPKLLYVYNLPARMPVRILKSVFRKALAEKFSLSYDPVLHAIMASDQSYAILEFASEHVAAACLQLYVEDRSVFDGLKVCLPRFSVITMDRPSVHGGYGMRKSEESHSVHDDGYPIDEYFAHTHESNERSRYVELERRRRKSMPVWEHEIDEERKTLYLTELPPNSSALSIRQLFEDMLLHYIGPPLVSSSGRRLVLDVRIVPTKGCAFVDMATPELVDFMLDLHYQKPEMFDYMKMEIGNKYGNDAREVNYHSDWLAEDARTGRFVPRGRGNLEIDDPLVGYGSLDRTNKRMKNVDYMDDFRDYYTFDVRKHYPKSDPEKTVFAYGLPTNATEKMIYQIFERALCQVGKAALSETIVSDVRIPATRNYCFIVFETQELAHLALRLYAEDRYIFDKIHVRPHVHSQNEERFWNCFKERNQDFKGSLKSIEFAPKKNQSVEDHLKSFGSKSKFQAWKSCSLSSERYVPVPLTH
eukprot:TRINITY_DN799_c0_g2_i4.p1 TRINITY_DN799_c0_g2~~TRINITY_DN799_c0_g2_i4.p1  ORF type:complete len:724 (-),score=120.36 TRINITY_DN799_c0_g2_i4:510-2681(-)